MYICIGDSGYGPQAEDTLEVKITCKYGPQTKDTQVKITCKYIFIGESGCGPQTEDTLEAKITCEYVCIVDRQRIWTPGRGHS